MAAGDDNGRGFARSWGVVALLVVACLGAGELAARLLEPEFAADRVASDAEEISIKRDRLKDLVAGGDSPDVLVVGASDLDSAVRERPFVAASQSFDSVFNASLLGLSPGPMRSWIDDTLSIVDDPKVLVVGINLLTPALDDRPGQKGVQVAQLQENIRASRDTIGARVRDASEPSALVRNRTALRQPRAVVEAAWNQVRGEDDVRTDLRPAGFWESNVDEDGSVREYRDATYDPERLLPGLTTTAEEINRPGGTVASQIPALLDHLASLDLRVVVVIPPIPVDDLIVAGAQPDRVESLRRIITGGSTDRGLTVLDYSALPYPRSWFADRSHLNERGSTGFSRDLAATLDPLANGE